MATTTPREAIITFWRTDMTQTVDDLAKPDGYFRVIGVRILVGKEWPIESSPDHERVHRALDVTVAVVTACSGRPICLIRTWNSSDNHYSQRDVLTLLYARRCNMGLRVFVALLASVNTVSYIAILDLSYAISRKLCKIGAKFVLITNRKSHMSFR